MFLFISFAIMASVGFITDRALGHQSALEPRVIYPEGISGPKRVIPLLIGFALIVVVAMMNVPFGRESGWFVGWFMELSILWLTLRFLRFNHRYYDWPDEVE